MLIDSHCHLPNNIAETKNILERAKENGVTKFVNMSTSLEDSEKTIRLSKNFPEVFPVAGIYPHEHKEIPIEDLEKQLEALLEKNKEVVAIGECGIDISEWENQRPIKEQVELFEMQLQLAKKCSLPVCIHNRNGEKEVLMLLERYPEVTAVAHCFTQEWEYAKKLLDLGVYISFSGFITRKSREHLHETVKNVPKDMFVLETDAPYIVPKGVKDKINEPKNVKIVAQKVADIRNSAIEEIESLSYQNTCKLFNLDAN